jgi:RNA polymerase sigma-70 factor (ECF subfamily)
LGQPSGGAAEVAWDWHEVRRRCLLLASRVAEPSDAEDVAQEAALKAWRHRAQCRTPERPGAWLAQITQREAIRVFKRRRGETPTEEVPERESGEALDEMAERLTVRAAIAALDDVDRALMELRYGADLTNGQIAVLMRLPEGTVKVRLHRARARMRAALTT